MYIIQKGAVKISFEKDSVKFINASSLMSEIPEDDLAQSDKVLSVEKSEGSYFGEWTLLGEHIELHSITAVGEVVCAVLTQEKFELVAGPLAKLSQDDRFVSVLFKNQILEHNFLISDCMRFWFSLVLLLLG